MATPFPLLREIYPQRMSEAAVEVLYSTVRECEREREPLEQMPDGQREKLVFV